MVFSTDRLFTFETLLVAGAVALLAAILIVGAYLFGRARGEARGTARGEVHGGPHGEAHGGASRSQGDRGRPQSRLAVVETLDIGLQHQLLLLRRDGVEHLVLVGGTSDLVVETDISRPAPDHSVDLAVPRSPRAEPADALPAARQSGRLDEPAPAAAREWASAPATQARYAPPRSPSHASVHAPPRAPFQAPTPVLSQGSSRAPAPSADTALHPPFRAPMPEPGETRAAPPPPRRAATPPSSSRFVPPRPGTVSLDKVTPAAPSHRGAPPAMPRSLTTPAPRSPHSSFSKVPETAVAAPNPATIPVPEPERDIGADPLREAVPAVVDPMVAEPEVLAPVVAETKIAEPAIPEPQVAEQVVSELVITEPVISELVISELEALETWARASDVSMPEVAERDEAEPPSAEIAREPAAKPGPRDENEPIDRLEAEIARLLGRTPAG